MAIFNLHHHQGKQKRFFKLLSLSLPLFCLLTWASSTTTTPPPSPSALAASRALKSRGGYSIFSAIVASSAAAGPGSWNGTGTVLAPPDFSFSFAAAKLNSHRRRSPPPRPSVSLLLHHTLKQPLTWRDLAARANGHELRTWHTDRCVFVSKGINGNYLAIAAGSKRKPIAAVKIRHPDLYVDDHLTVHGVDDVLDPTEGYNCSFPDPTAEVQSQIDRSFLDHAVRALRGRGYGVVATAMAIKQSDLINQTGGVTVFAPSDASLFSDSDGFHYDFLHHVVPKHHRFADVASFPPVTAIETMSTNKTVVIRQRNGGVTVDGVSVHSSEVYHNRWIVVLSVSQSIDDAGDSEAEARMAGGASDPASTAAYSGISVGESPLPGDSELNKQFSGYSGMSPVADGAAAGTPARSDGGVSTLSPAVEGEEDGTSVDVERSPPSNGDGHLLFEKLVESGPSHDFNRPAELVVESRPYDENQTGMVSMVEIGRRVLSSLSNSSESWSEKPGVPSDADHLSIAGDLFYYL